MTKNIRPYTENPLPEIIITYTTDVAHRQRIQLRSSRDTAIVFRQLLPENAIEYKEYFYVLCLNRKNQILGYFLHSLGGLSGTIVDTKQIFAVAITANAASIILCHNHPSGNCKPSTADIDITSKMVTAASVLDMAVLDHVILTKESFYSFADEGMLPIASTKKIVGEYY